MLPRARFDRLPVDLQPLRYKLDRERDFKLGRLWLSKTAVMLVILIGPTACQSGPKGPASQPTSKPAPETKTSKDSDRLLVPPTSYDFGQNPKLLERIVQSPHGYYRFINVPFSQEVCDQFEEEIRTAPTVNLHGDAHLEQYAITDLGRGLTDFDDSSTGPALIDLLRFGVSLRLTCIAQGWETDADGLYQDFLRGYRTALDNPKHAAPEPKLAKVIREKFKADRSGYFKWIDSIMEPMEGGTREELVQAMKPYVETMLKQEECSRDFFNIVNIGYLKMGIGSALDQKFLIRVRGPTDSPNDDVVLEVKEVRDLSGIGCVQGTKNADPFRILVGQSRIAYKPYRFLGYVRLKERTFWIHSWVDNYKELKIRGSFESKEDLAEVVYDVGVQLGQGHVKKIAEPLGHQLRAAQIRMLDRRQKDLSNAVVKLTKDTINAWEHFRSRIEKSNGSKK